jgi:hypothetical protein
MKQKKLFTVIIVTFLSLSLILLSALSYGGRAGAARATESIEAQLGIRLSEPISENMRIGSIVNGMIIDDGKLAKFGFQNAKRGDKVKLKLIGEGGKFEVMHGGRLMNFLMEDKGNIKLVK